MVENEIIIDGLESLKALFDGNEDKLVDHVINNILFMKKDIVIKQAEFLICTIEAENPIPVRYNSNGAFFLRHAVKTTTPNFKNKGEAVRFTNNTENKLFHRETKIRICFDRDGNYYPKRAIYDNTGHWVSCGNKSTVVNYIIAHIWNKTDNPLYFSLLWNYCLIPCHCAFLTDKHDDTHPVIKRVKNLIKAISIELYNPNRIMNWSQDIIQEPEMPPKEAIAEARKYIKNGKINFLNALE